MVCYYEGNVWVNNVLRRIYESKVKVKLSLYRPRRPLGLREVEAYTFSDIRLIGGGKVVSHMRRLLFTRRRFLVLISITD
jgi:hypothetical protein